MSALIAFDRFWGGRQCRVFHRNPRQLQEIFSTELRLKKISIRSGKGKDIEIPRERI